ncbi:MAG TPA: hypothetical protein VHA78_05025 [Candidatus Peribacteraceae bacterium]|nr:hypothetical protein [Candidatus Peribacteraceae bacterium]
METRRGRPGSVTAEKSAIFLIAMENGLTLKEALIDAGISDDAYRRLLDKSADFRGQIEVAKMKLQILAKAGMAKKIKQGDGPMIRWYLERKLPEEFVRRSQEGVEDDWKKNVTVILPGSKPHPRILYDIGEDEEVS